MNRPPHSHPLHPEDPAFFGVGGTSGVVLTPELCVAGLPHLLGFWPERSLIVMALSDDVSRPIVATLRIDLPDCENSCDRADMVRSLREPLTPASQLCESMVIVVWSDTPLCNGAHRDALNQHADECDVRDQASSGLARLIDEVVDMTQHLGVPVADALIVHCESPGSPALLWKSTMCRDSQCCDPHGNSLSEKHHRLARQLFSNSDRPPAIFRNELEREITGVPVPGVWPAESSVVTDAAFDIAVLHSIFALCDQGDPSLDDGVLMASALSNRAVRDAVLCEVLRLPRMAWSNAAEVLAEFVRICPPECKAPLATLLGIMRWQLGDGVRAAIALEHALAADPDYSLARLMGDCIASGIHPGTWRKDLARLNPRPY